MRFSEKVSQRVCSACAVCRAAAYWALVMFFKCIQIKCIQHLNRPLIESIKLYKIAAFCWHARIQYFMLQPRIDTIYSMKGKKATHAKALHWSQEIIVLTRWFGRRASIASTASSHASCVLPCRDIVPDIADILLWFSDTESLTLLSLIVLVHVRSLILPANNSCVYRYWLSIDSQSLNKILPNTDSSICVNLQLLACTRLHTCPVPRAYVRANEDAQRKPHKKWQVR